MRKRGLENRLKFAGCFENSFYFGGSSAAFLTSELNQAASPFSLSYYRKIKPSKNTKYCNLNWLDEMSSTAHLFKQCEEDSSCTTFSCDICSQPVRKNIQLLQTRSEFPLKAPRTSPPSKQIHNLENCKLSLTEKLLFELYFTLFSSIYLYFINLRLYENKPEVIMHLRYTARQKAGVCNSKPLSSTI